MAAVLDKVKGIPTMALGIIHSTSMIGKAIFIILVVIIFVIALYMGSTILSYFLNTSSPYVIKGLVTGSNPKVIPQTPSGAIVLRSNNKKAGIEFSWSTWINITHLGINTSNYQHIFSKGDNDNVAASTDGRNYPNNAPGLYIAPGTNNLVVMMNTFETIDEEVIVSGVPLNKWVHVVIRITGKFLDVYINGTLTKRQELKSVPRQNGGNVYVCMNGGFNGYLSDLRYFDYSLQPGDILALARKGPNLKMASSESSDLTNNPQYLSLQWYFQK